MRNISEFREIFIAALSEIELFEGAAWQSCLHIRFSVFLYSNIIMVQPVCNRVVEMVWIDHVYHAVSLHLCMYMRVVTIIIIVMYMSCSNQLSVY